MIAPLLLASVAQADISMGNIQIKTASQGNCDLLATNTVRATFKGLQDSAVTAPDGTLTNGRVAVFEVIENLAHRRQSRYGDGAMQPGSTILVEMSRDLPGQPAEIVDTISKLEPGEETVMRMDHLFLYGEPNGSFVRPCARMARKEIPTPSDVEAEDPDDSPLQNVTISMPGINGHATISGSGQFSGHSFYKTVTVDAKGNKITQEIETRTEQDPKTGKAKTRMFINGIEVDPKTRQPLMPSTVPDQQPAQPEVKPEAKPDSPVQPPAPAPAPKPTPNDPNDDTILESESF